MKVAIVGSGIAGLTCAYLLARRHPITLFESQGWLGGHARTLNVALEGETQSLEVGVSLFNDRTYPHFLRLLRELGVGCRPAEFSVSVSDARTGIEFAGRNLNSLLARRRNLFSPTCWRLLQEVRRFSRDISEDLHGQRISDTLTLGQYLQLGRYGWALLDYYLLPLAGTLWALTRAELLQFPLGLFSRTLQGLGLLSRTPPQWYVVEGGTRSYVNALSAHFAPSIRLNCPVWRIERDAQGVTVMSAAGAERYDKLIFACHSDQALNLLTRPTMAEQSILGALPFADKTRVLHTDTALLPQRRRAWATGNCRHDPQLDEPLATLDLTGLQGAPVGAQRFCLSLRPGGRLAPDQVVSRLACRQPLFSPHSVQAQARWRELCGPQHTYYCGAYWGSGFHEDGVVSALRVAEAFGAALPGSAPAASVSRMAVCS